MSKKTIPTAEEFSENYTWTCCPEKDQVLEAMIEFAKLHVQEAQKSYFEKIKQEGLVTEAGVAYLENAYPLTNIK